MLTFLSEAKDKNFWLKVRQDEKYSPLIDELKSIYQKHGVGEIVDISYELFMIYHKTGSRKEFQTPYYSRRSRLNSSALLSLIYPENEEYFSNLCNTIWAICNEYSWSLPVHTPNSDIEYNDNFIDLFSAETGFALSEIKYLLNDRLPVLIKNRIHAEIEKRIVNSYLNNVYWWESAKSNWAAVCASGVGCAFMYERPDLFYSIMPRLNDTFKSFFSSFKADGVCREGMDYWGYGFGFFTCYAQMLLEFSDGKINLFENEKTKTIAKFPSMGFISDGATISFSDGAKNARLYMSVIDILSEHYGDEISYLPYECYETSDACARWCVHVRAFVYFNPENYKDAKNKDAEYFMEDSSWFSRKCKSYGFAAKAGDNDEPHNHNDIGSFIFAANGKQVLLDFGAGEYTKDYFSPDTRYSIFVNRSMGHSVPIVNSLEQKNGIEFSGTMKKTKNGIEIDMTNAYPKNSVTKLLRSFEFSDREVVLKDSYEASGSYSITERFITDIKPKISDCKLILDTTTLTFDSLKWEASFSETVISNHNEKPETLYAIDFKKISETDEFKLVINV